jgi:hypothetical protein
MIWSRNEQWMLTGDDKGYVKYWQANMNNVKMFQGHINESIRGLRYKLTTKLIVIVWLSLFFMYLFFLISLLQLIKLPKIIVANTHTPTHIQTQLINIYLL